MISIQDFKLICTTTKIVKFIIFWMIVANFIYQSYLYFYDLPEFIKQIIHFQGIDKNNYIHYFMKWGIMLLWFVGEIIVLKIIYSFIMHLPVSSKWICKWQENKEIDGIMGRQLVNYYRMNTRLNFESFHRLIQWSYAERYYFQHHQKNQYLNPLFKEFDPSYQIDKAWFEKED